MLKVLTKVFGSKYERDIKRLRPIVAQINELYERFHSLSDEEMRRKTFSFMERIEEERERIRREMDGEDPEEIEKAVKEREAEILDEILPEAYALVKETCRRLVGQRWKVRGHEITWDMIPYDVQLMGAIVLHEGKIAEMATGEGKTLVATMPLYLNALVGRGAHLVTVNDYLAARDREWMGPIYEFLGLTVDYLQNEWDTQRRKEAYRAHITYGTNNEFGFDYLRDNYSTYSPEDLVQRELYYAIVDEVDSILIDEARTPLIISGPVEFGDTGQYRQLKPMVEKLVRQQTLLVNRLVAEGEKLLREGKEYEAGIKLLQAMRGAPKNKRLMKLLQEEGVKRLIAKVEADYLRDKKMHELDAELFFVIDEKAHTVDITDKGIDMLSPAERDIFTVPNLSEEIQKIEEDESLSPREKAVRQEELHREYAIKNEKVHSVHQLLRAYSLFEKDVEYVVMDGRVVIVDEFTGRLMPGRRFSDGLHEALEAKEGVEVQRETQTLATITIQNFFRMYHKLAGMTGTAETEAQEFWDIYKLEVVVIPTNKPVRRIDYDDFIYRTKREKYNAIIEEIERLHRKNLPVLVGTISVEVSETLSRMLRRRGIPHQVLNAKYHQREAEIVAMAGQPGAVTIATNMAGRGTDIKLGPGVVKCPEGHQCALVPDPNDDSPLCPYFEELGCREDVPCGLHIIGTERHEARRIDRQLRGRAGRQGDPGASRFFISLEDDLMRLFGSERIAAIMDKMGAKEGEVITHPLVTKSIERAQKRVEQRNFEIRKRLLEYDDVMNRQREVIYGRRKKILLAEDLEDEIRTIIEDVVADIVEAHTNSKPREDWDLEGLRREFREVFLIEPKVDGQIDLQTLEEVLSQAAWELYERRRALFDPEQIKQFERMALLSAIDDLWKEHLYEMDLLREGISLRAYGQRDPLVEYKREAFEMFEDLVARIDREAAKALFWIPVQEFEEPRWLRRRRGGERLIHEETTGMGFKVPAAAPPPVVPVEATGPGPVEVPEPPKKPSPVRVGKKVGRNDPCPCGSGKKYKNCCGRKIWRKETT